MRRIVALSLASSMIGSAALAAGAPRAQSQPASLSGTASSSAGQTLANVTVQLRDVATGQLAGTTTSTATGAFSFGGLQAGTYTVEVVSATAAAIAAGTAAGAAVAGGTAAAGGISTAVIVTTVAAAAGVAGAVAVATNGNASPSR